jgi:hypothetical protein
MRRWLQREHYNDVLSCLVRALLGVLDCLVIGSKNQIVFGRKFFFPTTLGVRNLVYRSPAIAIGRGLESLDARIDPKLDSIDMKTKKNKNSIINVFNLLTYYKIQIIIFISLNPHYLAFPNLFCLLSAT